MNKILLFILLSFFTACSAAYLNQYQGKSYIELSASYGIEKNGIALIWGYSEESVHMEILRGTSAENLQPVKTLFGQNSWLDTSMSAGTEYFYRVNALNPQGRTVASSPTVKGLRAYQDSSTPIPSGFRIDFGSSLRKIPLSWIGSEGQTYRLYRSLFPDAEYYPIAVLVGSSYQDSALTPGTSYYYKLSVIYQDAAGSVQEKFYGSGLGDISGGAYIAGKTLSDTL